MNVHKFYEMLHEMEDAARLAPISGGTVSAASLIAALRLTELAETPHQKKRCEALITVWRAALRRHNAQIQKVVHYNLETGKEDES